MSDSCHGLTPELMFLVSDNEHHYVPAAILVATGVKAGTFVSDSCQGLIPELIFLVSDNEHHFVPAAILVAMDVKAGTFVSNSCHGLTPELSYFSFQLVFHDWYNKGCGMCYPVCGMMHIKEPLLLLKE